MQGKFGDKKPALVLRPTQNLPNSCDKKKGGQVRKSDLEQTEDSERDTGVSARPLLLESFSRSVFPGLRAYTSHAIPQNFQEVGT